MIKKIEKIAHHLIVLSLVAVFISWFLPVEPVKSAITVSATVSSEMVSCTTDLDGSTNSFGTIDNAAVYSATTSATTISSSGTIYLKALSQGSGTNPGLWKNPDLIESPNAAFDATATLAANTEGYGIVASTTGSMDIDARYNYASSTYIVGGLASTTAATVASSAAVSGQVIYIDYQAAVSVSTPGGSYEDTVTLSCTTS